MLGLKKNVGSQKNFVYQKFFLYSLFWTCLKLEREFQRCTRISKKSQSRSRFWDQWQSQSQSRTRNLKKKVSISVSKLRLWKKSLSLSLAVETTTKKSWSQSRDCKPSLTDLWKNTKVKSYKVEWDYSHGHGGAHEHRSPNEMDIIDHGRKICDKSTTIIPMTYSLSDLWLNHHIKWAVKQTL